MRAILFLVATALPLAALPLGRASAALDAASAVTIERTAFDVFARKDDKKIGRMTLRVTRVAGVVVVEAEFAAAFKDDEAGYTSKLHYRTGEKPRLVRAGASTRIGDVKLMEGTLEMGEEPDPGPAKLVASGYADHRKRFFAEPKKLEREVARPEGVVLAYPSFLYFAPRLLRQTGRLEGVVYADLPDDLVFPDFVEFFGDCHLVRTGGADLASCRIELRQQFPGGNHKVKAGATYDESGRIVEATFAGFVMRPPKEEDGGGDETTRPPSGPRPFESPRSNASP